MKVAYAVCLLALFGQCFCDGEKDAVSDYTAWTIVATNGIVDQCKTGDHVSPHDSCMKAANGTLNPSGEGAPASYHENSGTDPEPTTKDGKGSWDAMCTALEKYSCTYDDSNTLSNAIDNSNDCCTGKTVTNAPSGRPTCPTTADAEDKSARSDCCGKCIKFYTPEPPAPPPSPDSPSEESGDTTVKTGETTTAPATTQGPAPGSTSKPGDKDTTTIEPTESTTATEEGGSDSDSAINIGASGLLVTLITMMAAGVNIA